MVERVPRIHDVRGLADVLVREEAGLGALDSDAARSQGIQHGRRGVHRDDPCAVLGCNSGEEPGARAEVDERRLRPQSALAQKVDVRTGVESRLAVVAGDVRRVAMLGAGELELVRSPCGMMAERAGRVNARLLFTTKRRMRCF
jgi:hypothetical protein